VRVDGFRERVVVQRYVPHDAEDLVSCRGFASATGEVLASFVGRKIRTYPRAAGASACVELVSDAATERAALAVTRRLGLVGPFKIDLLRTRSTGELLTHEVNLRFTLWSYLGAVDGVNRPLTACRSLVEHRPPPPSDPRPRTRWLDLDRDYRARRELGLSLPRWLLSLARGPNVYEVFAWDDPLPALVWLRDVLSARLRGRCSSV
jgi:predicted ATP-grasp superfamily ATP-dependent carboligase